jgi:hypothetical protein
VIAQPPKPREARDAAADPREPASDDRPADAEQAKEQRRDAGDHQRCHRLDGRAQAILTRTAAKLEGHDRNPAREKAAVGLIDALKGLSGKAGL